MIGKRPELLRRFLRGWFKTVAFMKANKAAAVKSGARVVEVRESIVSKVYDTQIGSFSTDGAWDPQAIDVIRNSLKDLGILDFIAGCQDDLQRQVRAGKNLTCQPSGRRSLRESASAPPSRHDHDRPRVDDVRRGRRRADGRRRSMMSRSRSARASSFACSALRAAARARCSPTSAGCSRPPRVR